MTGTDSSTLGERGHSDFADVQMSTRSYAAM